jgi:hypothetical protein
VRGFVHGHERSRSPIEASTAQSREKIPWTPGGITCRREQLVLADRIDLAREYHTDERPHAHRLQRNGGTPAASAFESDEYVGARARARHLDEVAGDFVSAPALADRIIEQTHVTLARERPESSTRKQLPTDWHEAVLPRGSGDERPQRSKAGMRRT